ESCRRTIVEKVCPAGGGGGGGGAPPRLVRVWVGAGGSRRVCARAARELRERQRSDLSAIVARLRKGDLPLLRQASWKMYDSYLKANRVDAGVRSYGAVVTLILRAKFDDGWRPVRRGRALPRSSAPRSSAEGTAPSR